MFKIIVKELTADWLEWAGKHLMDSAMDPILPDGWLGEQPNDWRCFAAVAIGSLGGACLRGSEYLNG